MINIYLDVDGVLNAISKNPPRDNTQWREAWGHEMIEGFPILWSRELVVAFNDLARRDDVVVKWLTTWQDLAATSLSLRIGLNGTEWHYFTSDDMDDLENWWKLAAIQKDIEETKPDKVVWIDDDIPYEKNSVEWVKSLGPIMHAVSPNSNHGLTQNQMNGIIDFIT